MAERTPGRTLPEHPTLDHEEAFWRSGFSLVAGVDEVGRGALAGPLVAAAVILPAGQRADSLGAALLGVTDSKLLDHATRVRLAASIRLWAAAWAFGVVEAGELDAIGVSAANRLAMERAVSGLRRAPDALLLDARVVDLHQPQVGLIKGDRISMSIASAAILAKVERDRMMVQHHETFDRYGFARHKGYGTAAHLAALHEHGPCSLHRQSFTWERSSCH